MLEPELLSFVAIPPIPAFQIPGSLLGAQTKLLLAAPGEEGCPQSVTLSEAVFCSVFRDVLFLGLCAGDVLLSLLSLPPAGFHFCPEKLSGTS